MPLPSNLKDLASKTKFLQELVDINSGTGNISGVAQVLDLVQTPLRQMGFSVERRPNPLGPNTASLLEAVREVKGKPFITFVTHADTVFETNVAFQKFELAANRKTAKGPGTIDDKGGIIVALAGIAQALEGKNSLPFGFRFLCTPSEETGSQGFHDYFHKTSESTALVLGFEPSLEKGAIIEARQGGRWYSVSVAGREGHAGRSHREGVNAGHDIAQKLDKLQRLTNYPKEVTVSIGHIQAGQDKFNIICGHAHAKIDTRFPNLKEGTALHKKIDKILKTPLAFSANRKEKTNTTYSVSDDCPPFAKDKSSEKYVKAYLKAIKQAEGKSVTAKKSGGGADSNHLSRPGIAILDGLGAVGGGMHTFDEFIELSSLDTRAAALAIFLQSL